MQELLRRDVHPAELVLPDGRVLTGVRAFITTRRLMAYHVTPPPERKLDVCLDLPILEQIVADRASFRGPLRIETEAGTVIMNRGQGCGCGSPLKRLGAPVPWAPRNEWPATWEHAPEERYADE